ncbi:MAG: hypothetical protein GY774_32790 [Planctomycetes bacterium]|nr:hypothetical protein [Planctomycetota bacterium]
MNRIEFQKTISSNLDPPQETKFLRFLISSTAIRLFITCWLIYSLHFATNTVREIYPALSLADHFSFDVSEYLDLHPDIFQTPDRGAFINNNPGASILGAIPYFLSRPIIDRIVKRAQQSRAASPKHAQEYETIYPLAQEFYLKSREKGLDIKFGLAAGVMQVFCMAPLSALSVVVMFFVLINLTHSHRKAMLLALLYAFATPVFYRTAQLNQNLLVSHFAFFSFVILWRPWATSSRPHSIQYLIAGLLAGWTVVLDYSGVVVVFSLSIYMFIRWISSPKHTKTYFDVLYYILGVTLSLSVLLGYQWLCFGNPFFPAQHYMPPANFTDQGYRGINWPQLDLLWKIAFSMRYGLFVSAPLLILSLYIPGWIRNSIRIVNNRETWCILLICLSFFIFCSANQYGRMQFNSGVRHIVPITPFLFLIVAGVLIRMPAFLAIIFGIVATYFSWCLAMYRDVEQGFGVFESLKHITLGGFRLPWLTTLENMGYLKSKIYIIPLFILCAIALWGLWSFGCKSLPNRLDFTKS